MKRYLLFFGAEFYPGKAMSDFVGDFDKLEDAIKEATDMLYKDDFCTWSIIYDIETKRNVWDDYLLKREKR